MLRATFPPATSALLELLFVVDSCFILTEKALLISDKAFRKADLTATRAMSNLDTIDFGIGAAEQERHLRDFFYRSTSFDLACSEKTYLVLGPKGAGKSAIFLVAIGKGVKPGAAA